MGFRGAGAVACRSLCVRSFVQRAAADHIASCKGNAQKNRNHEKNSEELLVAEQSLRFAVVGPQHFYLKLYLRFAQLKLHLLSQLQVTLTLRCISDLSRCLALSAR